MTEVRTEHTDVGSMDLESLKRLAKDPMVELEIRGNEDVVIRRTTEG